MHWCRIMAAFSYQSQCRSEKVVVDWGYNAWGGKYPPFDLDDNIQHWLQKEFGLPVFLPGIVMEGGSVDFNGREQ